MSAVSEYRKDIGTSVGFARLEKPELSEERAETAVTPEPVPLGIDGKKVEVNVALPRTQVHDCHGVWRDVLLLRDGEEGLLPAQGSSDQPIKEQGWLNSFSQPRSSSSFAA